MPIFEYRCQMCGDDFEILVRSEEMKKACPGCGSTNLKKKFSTFGFKTGRIGMAAATSSSSCGSCSSHNCNGCHHH